DGDGVELLGDPARLLDLARHQLAEVLEVDVAGDELGERVDHRDDRFAEIGIGHAGCPPEPAGPRHVAAVRGGARAILRHGWPLPGGAAMADKCPLARDIASLILPARAAACWRHIVAPAVLRSARDAKRVPVSLVHTAATSSVCSPPPLWGGVRGGGGRLGHR